MNVLWDLDGSLGFGDLDPRSWCNRWIPKPLVGSFMKPWESLLLFRNCRWCTYKHTANISCHDTSSLSLSDFQLISLQLVGYESLELRAGTVLYILVSMTTFHTISVQLVLWFVNHFSRLDRYYHFVLLHHICIQWMWVFQCQDAIPSSRGPRWKALHCCQVHERSWLHALHLGETKPDGKCQQLGFAMICHRFVGHALLTTLDLEAKMTPVRTRTCSDSNMIFENSGAIQWYEPQTSWFNIWHTIWLCCLIYTAVDGHKWMPLCFKQLSSRMMLHCIRLFCFMLEQLQKAECHM